VKLSRHLLFFLVLFICFAAFQIGCWQKNDKNPVAALPDSNIASSVAFKIVTPANQAASFSAAIRSSSESQALITIQLKLANFGNSLTPFSLVRKQAPVVNGSATITFESLPNTTVVGSLQIENGNINGFSNFHGAADLNQGSNIVELVPVGSLMPQDVLANAVSEIVSSSTLLLKAPTTLATELAKIVSNLPLDSTSVYDEVLNNFSNRTGLPLVELLAPANAQTFTIGSSINIIASATDLDGNISKIEFFQNSIKIGEKSSLPFSLEWQPSVTGTYAVYAKAIDNYAAVGVSASITVVFVDSPPTHIVTYNGNGNTGGSTPTDNQSYQSGSIVTVKDNTGSLTKTGYSFAGWNTASDGSGTSYNPAATFKMGATNITLYAKWSLIPTYNVTYNGNGNTGGSVPTDSLTYQQSATITVKGNTGGLMKAGYIFAGWNTSDDGNGTNYDQAATFAIGTNNVILYAKWVLIPTLKYVPAGSFQQGGYTSYVSAFRMSEHEIHRTQFLAVMGADPSYNTYVSDEPVQRINWYHAIAFCNKLSIAEGLTPTYIISDVDFTTIAYADVPTDANATWDAAVCNWAANGYRLPTEMEWMWAAMGAPADGQDGGINTTGYLKAFAGEGLGGSVGDYAWYNGNSGNDTHSFGEKKANELGLFDMSGNVWEWCWDWYAGYPVGLKENYTGPVSGVSRIKRGGSRIDNALFVTVAMRIYGDPYDEQHTTGLRVVRQ